ncbi:MAG: glycoside hydrolase family 3 C-terminal domain-containing protein, partial [Bacteroidales bacterium]|nr:glycoside hydrolase family 3 C-terminal domain-containing protein [Bacteroidales bacterium]
PVLVVLLFLAACTTNNGSDRIGELLSEMTLEEKVGQLNQYTGRWEMTGPAPENDYAQTGLQKIESGELGSMLNVVGAAATRNAQQLAVENSRLGIPMIFGYDVIHGYRTMFPVPLGEAATWEPELARKTSRVAAIEAAAGGLHWTFAPMVDIARDARWGRIVEGSGEDPYLGSLFAYERVKGFQGNDLSANHTIAACAKHFAAYGFVEAGREYNTVDVSDNTLRNIILPPFKACLDAGVATFMNAFNVVGGVPATGNMDLVRGLLKGSWDFEGFVISDWNSVGEMIEHGVAADRKEAALLAINAGCDMDMEGYCYENHLKELVEEGVVDEKLLDDAVRRVLRMKEQLGLFDDPYRYCDEEREKEMLLHPDHLALAREVAKRSLVLLKNESGLLPLEKSGQKIVLIGELAGEKDSPLGNWRAQAIAGSAVSVVEGMQAKAEGSLIQYEKGPRYVTSETGFLTPLEVNTTDPSGIKEAVAAARRADVAVMVLGENCYQSAAARSVTDISLKGFQKELLDRVLEVNDHVVLVLMNGRPLDITAFIDRVPAVLVAWHPGSESGHAIADVLFGDYNPSGRLPISWPRSVGQLPLYYNHKNTGRPTDERNLINTSRYIDQTNDPLFPFGFGLSYTQFGYSGLLLSDTTLRAGEALQIKATITNKGNLFGEEVVQ